MILNKLKSRAKAHDMRIRKHRNGDYYLVDIYTNTLAVPDHMTLDEAALWLDDLDKAQQ
ncbi:hypothetical protein [Acutalibacter sp. 1XD8-33]|uniref:hypothetical protein n=1 Tax=Acutalibacter sp. 1XD8-33 TaxID=2320081 RepID=UPI0013144C57|nr:hypothetical protein [Acutalibacter sp. 1XD8-33]